VIRKQKSNSGLSLIYARVTVNGGVKEISIKRKVLTKDWNIKKGMAKGSRPEIKSLNLYLEEVRSMLVECYQQLKTSKQLITAQAIKSLYLGEAQSEHTLCKLMEYHNQNSTETLTPGTMKNYFTTDKYIKKYLKEKLGKQDIYLTEI